MTVLESLFALFDILLERICVIILTAVICGKDRTFKMYAPITPSLVLVIVVFYRLRYWLGKLRRRSMTPAGS